MTAQKTSTSEENLSPVTLRDPGLSALLAWLVPGLGHAYQGRWAKAIIFFVCIMSTFAYGLYLGSSEKVGWGRVVYASWQPGEKRLYYFCQLGVGLPALPALIQAIRVRGGKEPFGSFMAPPSFEPGMRDNVPPSQVTLDTIHRRLARYFELGTIYTSIAGLLNVLVILDAWAGPVITSVPGKEEEEETESEEDRETTSSTKQDSPA